MLNSELKNLIGNKINNLIILSYTAGNYKKNEIKKSGYLTCQCSCGKIKNIASNHFKILKFVNGSNCNCVGSARPKHVKINVGDQISKYKILESLNDGRKFKCLCVCGKQEIIERKKIIKMRFSKTDIFCDCCYLKFKFLNKTDIVQDAARVALSKMPKQFQKEFEGI